MNKQNLNRRDRDGISRYNYSSAALPWILSLITVLFVLNSCKKDNHRPDAAYGENELVVEFAAGTIPVSATDSGFVIFKKSGSPNQTFQRFDKDGSFYKMNIGSLNAGEWTADIYLYASVPNTTQKREYFQSKKLTLSNTPVEIKLFAPTGTHEDSWKRRAHFNFGSELNTFISMDAEDPYFRISIADKNQWQYFAVIRSAYKKGPGGSELLADAGWECYTDCFNTNTIFENTTHFVPLTNQAKGKPWNYGEIELIAIDKDSKEMNYFLPYNK